MEPERKENKERGKKEERGRGAGKGRGEPSKLKGSGQIKKEERETSRETSR